MVLLTNLLAQIDWNVALDRYGVGGIALLVSLFCIYYASRAMKQSQDGIKKTRDLIDKIVVEERAERVELTKRTDLLETALDAETEAHAETKEALGALQSAHRELNDQHTTTVKAFDGFRAQAADKEQSALKRIADLEADKRSLTARADIQADEIEGLKASIATLRKQISDEQEANRRLVAVNSDLQDEKQALVFQLKDITMDRDRLKTENGALEKRISSLEEQIAALRADGLVKEKEIQGLRAELNELKARQQTAVIISTGELPVTKVTQGDQTNE